MKTFKKSLLILFAVFTLTVLICFGASATTVPTSGKCGKDVTYTYNVAKRELVISGSGAMTDYSNYGSPFSNSDIRSVVIKSGVTTIGKYAFYECSGLQSVTIPDSVTRIEDSAFYCCESLQSVTIPDRVTTIGTYAFYQCGTLQSITIGNSVNTIGKWAFGNCESLQSVTIGNSVTTIDSFAFHQCSSIQNLTIPDSVTTMGDYAFYNCESLQSVTIGDSVATIGKGAFSACDSLQRVTVDKENKYYCNDDYGVLFDKNKNMLIRYPSRNTRTEYTIPNSVNTICDNAFSKSTALESVTIPDSVNTIGEYAFSYCENLQNLTLGKNVNTIGEEAFRSCYSLQSVTIPDSVDTIGDYAFYYCGRLKSVTIGNSVTTIGNGAFSDCDSLQSVTIPDSVTSMGDRVFYYCESLQSATIGNNVTSIGDYAFYYCESLQSITIGNNVTSIGDNAFYYCGSLQNITIPDSVITIGKWTFYSCDSLQSAIIGNGVTTIGNYAFYYCDSLQSAIIGNRVTSIGDRAFDCTNLKDIYYTGAKEQWKNINKGDGNSCLLYGNIHYDYCRHIDTTEKAEQKATCTAKGYTAGTYCNDCKDWISGHSEIAALSHDYEGVVTKKATCIAEGVKTFTCKNDKSHTYTKEISIDKNAHTWSSTGPECTLCKLEDEIVKVTKAYYNITSYNAGDKWNEDATVTFEAVFKKHTAKVTLSAYVPDGLDMNNAGIYVIACTYKGIIPEVIPTFTIYPVNTTSLTVSAQTTTTVTLKWTAATGANGYRIFYKAPGDTSWKTINETTSLSYKVRALKEGTKYTFAVRPYYDTGSEKLMAKTYLTIATATCTATPELTSVKAGSTNGKAYVYHTDVTGETGYTVYYSTNSDSGFKKYANFAADTTRCDITGLASGETYYFKVRTYIKTDSGYVYSPWSEIKSLCSHNELKTVVTPATLTADGKAETVCASCGYVKSSEKIAAVTAFSLSKTKYIHDGNNKTPKLTVNDADGKALTKNVDYKITVASKRAGIGRYTVKVSLLGNYSGSKNLYFYILPGATSEITPSGQTTSSVKLSWSEVSGAAGYTVYRYSASKKAYVKSGATTGTNITVDSLNAGTKYTFKIVAYGETSAGKVYDGETYTTVKTATCTTTPTISLTSSETGKVNVSWTDVKGETGYQVYYSTKKSSGYTKIGNYSADVTTLTGSKLSSDYTYYFKVRTYIKTDSGYVYSPFSAVKGIKVK